MYAHGGMEDNGTYLAGVSFTILAPSRWTLYVTVYKPQDSETHRDPDPFARGTGSYQGRGLRFGPGCPTHPAMRSDGSVRAATDGEGCTS